MILVLGNTKGGDAVESILDTVKKSLGIDFEDTSFDSDIIVSINSTIPSLSQMGIGPHNGFIVISREQKWSEYIIDNDINLEGVKTYLYLKTKLLFDPPTSSTVIEAIKDNIKELEWRMMLAVETHNLEV